jgi:hypothetical protein
VEPIDWQSGPDPDDGPSWRRLLGYLGFTVLLFVSLSGSLLFGLALRLSWAAVPLAVIFTCALASVIGKRLRISMAGIVVILFTVHSLAIAGAFLGLLVALSRRPSGSKSM